MSVRSGATPWRSVCLRYEGTPRHDAQVLRTTVGRSDNVGLDLLVTFPSMGKVTKEKKNYLCALKKKGKRVYTDNDNSWEEEDDDMTGEAVSRFEDMLESQRPVYFDAEEFGLIIDYYMQQNNLKLSRHPDDINLKIKNARQFLVENDPKKAFELLDQMEINYDDPDYFLTLGSCYAALGKHQKAIDTYTTALSYFEEDEKSELYHAIGFEYQSLGFFNKAIEFYKKSLDVTTEDALYNNTYSDLVNCFLSAGQTKEAIAYFNQRIDNDPHEVESWSAMGDIYRRMDRLEEAIEMYEYVLAIDPTHQWANMHLANSYYDLNRFQEAIDSLHEAMAHGLETSMLHASLGDCHYRLENYIDAQQEYNKALSINEYLTEAWSGLGYVYSDTGDSRTAIRYFEKAYALEPFNDDHLYNLAAEYRKLNENEKALSYLFEIEKREPNDPDLYFFLGDLLADMDRGDEAICYLNLGLQRTENDPTLLYLLAYLHLERNERNLALNYLEDALAANPDYYKEFIEYNPELITNDLEVMELINKIKKEKE